MQYHSIFSSNDYEIEYSPKLRDSLTSLHKTLMADIDDVIRCFGDNVNNYVISIHPFSIERLDKNPISVDLLRSIQVKLQSDQIL